MAYTILLIVLLFSITCWGTYGLKCYSYNCGKYDGIPEFPSPPNCTLPKEVQCNNYGAYVHCATQRITSRRYLEQYGKYLYTTVESRSCVSYGSGQCHIPDYYCKLLNSTGDVIRCDVGCCQGDLCNNGTPPTRVPEKPADISGSDLSCYTCSPYDFLFGINTTNKDCDRPVSATCGKNRNLRDMVQDRCMKLKAVIKVGNIKQVYNVRGCSDVSYCNQEFACKSLNASGMLESCDMSCCFGKTCNGPGPVSKPPTPSSGDQLSCYYCINDPSGSLSGINLNIANASCKSPATQTCGYRDYGGFRKKQDRCIWVQTEYRDKRDMKLTSLEIRNCSDSLLCQKDYICKAYNSSGLLTKCEVSCCTGNYCNGVTLPGNNKSTSTVLPSTEQSTGNNKSPLTEQSAVFWAILIFSLLFIT